MNFCILEDRYSEFLICKRGHMFYAGYIWCPVCEIYEEADKEDKQ